MAMNKREYKARKCALKVEKERDSGVVSHGDDDGDENGAMVKWPSGGNDRDSDHDQEKKKPLWQLVNKASSDALLCLCACLRVEKRKAGARASK